MDATQSCSHCTDMPPQWAQDALSHEIQGLGRNVTGELLGWSLVNASEHGRVGHIVYAYHTDAWETKSGIKFDARDTIRYYTFSIDGDGNRSGGMGGVV